MKTPEENKCGMECIRTNVERSCAKPEKGQCPRCKQLVDDSLAYIQQLEREKNALLAYVPHNCWSCKKEDQRHECKRPCVWEWRGVCEENTKEDSNV